MDKKKSIFLRIDKKDAQKFLDILPSKLNGLQVINSKFHVIQENNFVFFPIKNDKQIRGILRNQLGAKLNFTFLKRIGTLKQNYKFRTIEEALTEELPKKYFELIPNSYDIIGKIAILEFDIIDKLKKKEYTKIKKKIAKATTLVNKNVATVYEKKSEVYGTYRIRKLKFLYGDKVADTIHHENSCKFKLNVKKVYFTPRLNFERKRITSCNIKKGEIIADLFAGVGPFSIEIAKMHDVKIFAFDINPKAVLYLKENITLNKMKGEIIPFQINVHDLLNSNNQIGLNIKNSVDRVIMNLPESSIHYLRVACHLLKNQGGIIHFYQFSEKPNPIQRAIESLKFELKKNDWRIVDILSSKKVKSYSPKSELVALDVYVNKMVKKEQN
ncbi:MAG: methyltransferase [Candidatus Lokiarchaeota archaeon]|nr:methyltransferase [Candidatus Lokiarchaeota archaeon]